MRFKILLLISTLLLLTCTVFARPVFDSVGVENQNGKKVILHKVDPKDTYYAIGRRYDIKPNLIIQFNNNVPLHPGETVKVPTEIPFAESVNQPIQQAAKATEKQGMPQQFKVSAGETLYSIARRFNTTVDDIKTQNGLRSDILSPGQVLTIRAAGPPTKQVEKEMVSETKPVQQPMVQQPRPQVQAPVVVQQPQNNIQSIQTVPANTQNTQQYKVSNGETLFTIAKRFNTSVDDIISLNKLSNNNISPGQILTVRSGMPSAPAPVVAKRDTTMVAASDSMGLDRHLPSNRYGLFEKNEKGPATWMDDPSFDPNKKLVLHRTAPIGTVIKITNPMTNRTTFAKVVGRFNDNESNKDVILVVTKNVAESLGAFDKRFRVDISYGVANNDQ